jgi:BlaI family penicillinase repressor
MRQAFKLFDAEYRLAGLVWEHEPIHSRDLALLCAEQFGWKRSTVYTVLKKLCEKGILRNDSAQVTALVKREQIQRYESQALVEKSFDGSLPKFIAAFLSGGRLSPQEAEQIKRLIDSHREE